MKHAIFILAALLLTPSAVLHAAEAKPAFAKATAGRPNIILVMPDDTGYGGYSCLGNPVIKTPAVDAFWKESVRLTDFQVSPTCAPTRSAVMSGRHEFKNGVTHTIFERERMSLETTTLAEVLKSAGYTTGIFGKWHLGDEEAYQPDRRGFDEYFIHGGGGIGQTFPGSCGDAPGNMYQDPAILHNGVFVKTSGYCTDVFFAQARRWMEDQHKEGRPFFAMITPNVAHAPLQCPEEKFQKYAGKVPDDIAKFYGMIENFDDNFGRMLAGLKEWGMADNTVVIFIGSDNGGWGPSCKVFNAGMRGTKGTPYQGGTRVPCFIRWPAQFKGGRDVAALAAHIDIFPTLAEIAGAPPGEKLSTQVEGRSLLPLLRDSKAAWPERFLVTHVGRWKRGEVAGAKFEKCAIRNSRFTLVNNAELYDLQADPGEATNVIEAHPAEVAKLRGAYDRWWEEVQPLLVNENAVGPRINPFKELYWKQFGGGPSEEELRKMDPASRQFKE